ncbi:MAG: glycosyltransferase family 39 protein [Lachnospiraceae bacterium]|nr:glycosyltransferase family 39 protein [Lachnospiraceae bacterium]
MTFIAFCICVAAFYFLSTVTEFVLRYLPNPGSLTSAAEFSDGDSSIKATHILFVFLTAFVTISICSKSSPLYPLNDWVDPNIYFTIGKSILHGKLPYRDLFDHKGPLMYLIHTLGALVSETSFLGVYFIEVAACAAFLWISLQIMRLYQKSVSILLIPVLAAVVYSSAAFSYGDSAEELCLPFLAYAIYIGLKAVRAGEMPSYRECLLIGITSSCILWTKYSLLGLYIGWICVPAFLLLKSRKIQKLFYMLLTIAGGVLITTLPILAWFAVNHALSDLWTVYFYDNLFLYSNTESGVFPFSLLYNLWQGVRFTYDYLMIPTILLVIGLLFLAKKENKYEFFFFLTSAFGMFLLIFVGGRHYKNYPFILSAFAPISLIVSVGMN